jgi:hypothetical protein
MKFDEFVQKAQALVDANSCKKIYENDLEPFTSLFGLPYHYSHEFGKRMKQHYIASWYCTTERVGLSVYVLDGKIVAVSTKTARRNHGHINFVSEDAQKLVFDTVMQYIDWDFDDCLDHDDISDEWLSLDTCKDHTLITEMRI